MRLLSVAVSLCLLLVFLTSSIAIFYAFLNHRLALDAIQSILQKTGPVIGGAPVSQPDSTASIRQRLANDLALERLRAVRDSALDSQTVSFLFTVFSLTFISVGMFILTKAQKIVDAMEGFAERNKRFHLDFARVPVAVEQISYLGSNMLVARALGAKFASVWLPTLREQARHCLSGLEGLRESRIGYPREYGLFLDDVLLDARKTLDTLLGDHDAFKDSALQAQDVLESIERMSDLVGRAGFVDMYSTRTSELVPSYSSGS